MPPTYSDKLTSIQGVKLASSHDLRNITIDYSYDSPHGTISSITPHDSSSSSSTSSSQPPLVLPSLVHPHIHLDKAFIHSEPEYAHLLPASGTFEEALSFTTAAKKEFALAGVLKRGEWLLAESVHSGVTAMRAFVEVDHTVKMTCVEAATILKKQWSESCEIQIVCFAQDPIFSTEHGNENMTLINQALEKYPEIAVIGTTPYVESSIEKSKQNIEWAICRALELNKHLDFHLDYNLDKEKEALIWHVLQCLIDQGWTTQSTNKQVMLGHCTRLTLFTNEEWKEIAHIIHSNNLPVTFVGLPTSDLYMASLPFSSPDQRHTPRGTLHIPNLIRQHGLNAVMGVNNLGNAFTPWGSADPLSLASLGVGIYQAGTRADAELLYECVSTRARAAIGLDSAVNDEDSLARACSCVCPTGEEGPRVMNGSSLVLREGGPADMVLFCEVDPTGCGVLRPRGSVAAVVWDPPVGLCRDVIFRGKVKVGISQNLPGNDSDKERYSFCRGRSDKL